MAMRLSEIISEARRNPLANTREHPTDAMMRYAHRADVFVSFTHDVGSVGHGLSSVGNVDGSHAGNSGLGAKGTFQNARGSKIGINPRSMWETPVGIYAYPIDYVLQHGAEFGTRRAYAYVVQAVDMGRILDLSTYSKNDLANDLKKLERIALDNGVTESSFDFMTDVCRRYPSGKQIWMLTKTLAGRIAGDKNENPDDPDAPLKNAKATAQWNKLFRSIGYVGVVDRGHSIIHENEPTQAVFFSKAAIRELEAIYMRDTKDEPRRKYEPEDDGDVDLGMDDETLMKLLKGTDF